MKVTGESGRQLPLEIQKPEQGFPASAVSEFPDRPPIRSRLGSTPEVEGREWYKRWWQSLACVQIRMIVRGVDH